MKIFGLQKQLRYSIYLLKIVLLKFIFNQAVVNNGIYQFFIICIIYCFYLRPLHFVKIMLDGQATINIYFFL